MWPSLRSAAARLLEPMRPARSRPAEGEGVPAGLSPVVVVTGGSQGIGYAIAEQFAGLGLDVVLIARDELKLAAAADALGNRRQSPAGIRILALDLTQPDAADRLAVYLESHALYGDILVNNAAIGLSGPFLAHQRQEIDTLLALNIAAVTRLAHRFLPEMVARGRGGILNVASIGGLVPGPHQAAYYASKAYVIALSEALANEVAGTGVRVCCVAPGPVATTFHARMKAIGSLYLRLPGKLSARAVARSAIRGYMLGQPMTVPGMVQKLNAVALRLLPRTLTIPIMAQLLKRRRSGS